MNGGVACRRTLGGVTRRAARTVQQQHVVGFCLRFCISHFVRRRGGRRRWQRRRLWRRRIAQMHSGGFQRDTHAFVRTLQVRVLSAQRVDMLDGFSKCCRLAEFHFVGRKHFLEMIDAIVDRAAILFLDQIMSGSSFGFWSCKNEQNAFLNRINSKCTFFGGRKRRRVGR